MKTRTLIIEIPEEDRFHEDASEIIMKGIEGVRAEQSANRIKIVAHEEDFPSIRQRFENLGVDILEG